MTFELGCAPYVPQEARPVADDPLFKAGRMTGALEILEALRGRAPHETLREVRKDYLARFKEGAVV